jgi:hypothetical protein
VFYGLLINVLIHPEKERERERERDKLFIVCLVML